MTLTENVSVVTNDTHFCSSFCSNSDDSEDNIHGIFRVVRDRGPGLAKDPTRSNNFTVYGLT